MATSTAAIGLQMVIRERDKRIAELEAKVERLEQALRGVVDRWDATSGVVLSKDIGKAKAALEGE